MNIAVVDLSAETVHVLRAGLPICGFSDRVPMYWPPGHVWVTYGQGVRDVTCEKCRATAEGEPLK